MSSTAMGAIHAGSMHGRGLPDMIDDLRSGEMTEIIFVVEEDPEGGYLARAVGESIFTQAESVSELHERVRDAVKCHFDVGMGPELIRLHFVGDQAIAA
jgi:hypothetical protein